MVKGDRMIPKTFQMKLVQLVVRTVSKSSETEFSKFGGEEDVALVRAIVTNSEEKFSGDKRYLYRVNLCMLE